jgi:hypothetical protein
MLRAGTAQSWLPAPQEDLDEVSRSAQVHLRVLSPGDCGEPATGWRHRQELIHGSTRDEEATASGDYLATGRRRTVPLSR